MKNIFIVLCALLLISCHNKTIHGKFTITGDIKNVPDQKIFLEQLYFSERDPEVLDTDDIKNGHFVVSGIAPEEGMFQLRLENSNTGFLFINDKPDIDFTADVNDPNILGPTFNTPSNDLLKHFFATVATQRNLIAESDSNLNAQENRYGADTSKAADSIITVAQTANDNLNDALKKYLVGYIDTSSDPVIALFTYGLEHSLYPGQNLLELEKPVNNLSTRFAKSEAIDATVSQFNMELAQYKATPHVGDIAPNIDLPDTSANQVNLNSLRGQYVLVDFWASWCGPCRHENPNVVKAFTKYKDKNFTVYSVSLDSSKHDWEQAIIADKLNWHHVSDLKSWDSPIVTLYGFNAIPYNVLVDPQGKIIATDLRGKKLEHKLAALLK